MFGVPKEVGAVGDIDAAYRCERKLPALYGRRWRERIHSNQDLEHNMGKLENNLQRIVQVHHLAELCGRCLGGDGRYGGRYLANFPGVTGWTSRKNLPALPVLMVGAIST